MGTGIEAAGVARSSLEALDERVLEAPDRLLDLLPVGAYVCAADGTIVRFNRRAVELWGRTPKAGDLAERFCGSYRLHRLDGALLAHSECPMADVLRTGISVRDREVVIERPDGSRLVALVNIDGLKDNTGKVVGAINCFQDTTERTRVEKEVRASRELARQQALSLETINHINLSLAAELDIDRLVQAVTDAATNLVGAAFGAFFYNVVNEEGESYMLYTLSGAPRESFEKFPLPRNTAIFEPTFRGAGPVVLDDVTKDPRYGKNAPYHGMPKGHLPVRSYLALPVVARSGEVVGGLFFGHPEPGRFTERDAQNVSAVAVQAAIGFDNARAYQRAQKELAERRRVERHQELLLAELNHRVKNMLTVVTAIAAQTARATGSMEEFREAFSGRLEALARTYSLLTAGQWRTTPLVEIVEEALQPHLDSGSERISIAGPDLAVRPKAALSLGMILHELGTNASKYGALAVERGLISVEWQVVRSRRAAEEVRLRWREDGVDGLRPPVRQGFGTWLIETSARHDLGGAVNMRYRRHGLECDLRFPMERLRGQVE